MKNNKIFRFIIAKRVLLILFGILLIGSVLRLGGVFTKSFAFTYDVGRDLLAVWDLVHFVHFPFIGPTTGLPGVFYGPWWYYLLSPFFLLFNGDPVGIAFAMAGSGIITILLTYVLGKKIGGSFLGLATAAIISVSPVMVSISSQIWNPNIAPLFVVIVLLILVRVYETKVSSVSFFQLGLLLGLILDLEIIFGSLFFIGIVTSIFAILKFRIRLKYIITFLLGLFVIFSPRILFEIKNHFIMTKYFFRFFFGGGSNHVGLVMALFKNISYIFDHFSQSVAGSNQVVALLLIIIFTLGSFYFYKKSQLTEKRFLITSYIVVLVFVLGLTILSLDDWPHYLVGLPVFYVLILAIFVNNVRVQLKNIILPAVLLIFVIVLNWNPILFFQSLGKPLWVGNSAVYRNQLAVIDYVYNSAGGKSFKYVAYTPAVNDYTYRYLFKWYGPKKYGYKPSRISTTAFFILEPDPGYEGRLRDWLKLREKDGIVVKSKELESGIVVQTRAVH